MQLRPVLALRTATVLLAGALSAAWIAAAGVEPAFAATPSELRTARTLFQQAEKDEAEGRWSEALDKLERVARIKETAGVRFHIATCKEHLGTLVDALESYERAKQLAADTNAGDVLEIVEPEITRLRSVVATVKVQAPAGVGPLVVYVDHKVFADLPSGEAIRLDPGTHQVSVKVGGETLLDRLVTLSKGQTETLTLRDPNAKRPAPAQPKHLASEPSTEASTSGVPTMGIVAFGAGAVLGVGGYLAYAKADAAADESAKVCAASIACDSARADEVRRWDTVALGLWVGAALGVGVGVALTVARDPEGSSTALLLEPSRVNLRTSF
jgi:tetratricopeptide (TPR) repeat protein